MRLVFFPAEQRGVLLVLAVGDPRTYNELRVLLLVQDGQEGTQATQSNFLALGISDLSQVNTNLSSKENPLKQTGFWGFGEIGRAHV